MQKHLEAQVTITLGDYADDYDVKAIAEAIREQGHISIDTVDHDAYWFLVEDHEKR